VRGRPVAAAERHVALRLAVSDYADSFP